MTGLLQLLATMNTALADAGAWSESLSDVSDAEDSCCPIIYFLGS